jgi:hypothetical protein
MLRPDHDVESRRGGGGEEKKKDKSPVWIPVARLELDSRLALGEDVLNARASLTINTDHLAHLNHLSSRI